VNQATHGIEQEIPSTRRQIVIDEINDLVMRHNASGTATAERKRPSDLMQRHFGTVRCRLLTKESRSDSTRPRAVLTQAKTALQRPGRRCASAPRAYAPLCGGKVEVR